jgi:phosphohistidine phosphatase SixA
VTDNPKADCLLPLQRGQEKAMLHALRVSLFVVLLSALPAAAETWTDAALIGALREGGNVIVLRHGATRADQVDAKPFDAKDVVHQRQLNDQGRATAKAMGEALNRLEVAVSQVQSSQYNRAVETATLLDLGEVNATEALNEGGTTTMAQGNADKGAALRKLAAAPPTAGTNVILITHKPNIVGAFGKDWSDVSECEATIVRPDGKGGFIVVARVLVADWARLAHLN